MWTGRHVISIGDFARDDIIHILKLAARMEAEAPSDLLQDTIVATLFFEPSTRTRLSFEAAALKLGGRVIGFSDAAISSAKKGESLADTIRMVEQYANVIVLRHPHEGAARLASEASSVSILNGGDGANQHPTQTFLDLYTIDKLFPNSLTSEDQPLTITFAGDLRYGRTVHSLLSALTRFHARILMVAPKGLEMPDDHLHHARQAGLEIEIADNLQDAINRSDVLYMTRLQEERFPDPLEFDHVKNTYQINRKMLRQAPDQLRILHPLPRVNEIATDVDETHHAHYFAQAGNGLPVRQALLGLVLGKL